jgi:predicted permease
MNTLRGFWKRILGVFNKRHRDADLAAELDSHLQFHIDDNLRAGMSPEEARRQALIKLGGLDQTKESYRDRRGLPSLDSLLQDIRFALRMLRKNPGFAAVAILTLALGIGVNTAVFTAFDALVVRPFAVKQPDRLALVYRTEVNDPQGQFSYPDYTFYRDHNRSFSDLGLFAFGQQVTSSDLPATEPEATPAMANAIDFRIPQLLQGSARPISCFFVSGNYLSMLGARPLYGRILLSGDDQPGAPPVVLMSGNFWQRNFHSDPKVIGSILHLNGQALTIVGVTPVDYVGTAAEVPDVWVPFAAKLHIGILSVSDLQNHAVIMGSILGRLKPGVSISDAQAEMNVLAAQLRAAYPKDELGMGVRVVSGRNNLHSLDSSTWAIIVASMAAVALLLLIACANIAILLLARAVTRRKEIAVRLALGASRWRLLRQLLTESALLGLFAGAIGLASADWILPLLILQVTSALPSHGGGIALQLSPDARIFAYTLFLSCGAAVAFGLTPALQASKTDMNAAIKDGGALLGQHLSRSRARQALIAGQMTACLVLLISSVLLIRGSQRALTINPGFETRRVVCLQMYNPANLHYSQSRMLELNRNLVQGIETIPGIKSVVQASRAPLGGTRWVPISPAGATPVARNADNRESVGAGYSYITPGYFDTLSIPITRGRDFTWREAEGQAPVVIVSEATARRLWPDQDPLGKFLQIGSEKPSMPYPGERNPFVAKSEVIGVANNVRSMDLSEIDEAYVYLPLSPNGQWTSALLVRTEGDPTPMLPLIGREVRRADANLPVRAGTLNGMVSMDPYFVISRVGGVLASLVGALGVLLASMGVYGMISYTVGQRTHEIGIRMALGAGRTQVLRLILRDGMRPVVVGMLIGIAASAGVARLLTSILFGLNFLDPASFAGVSFVLVSVALLASWVPARRAMRVDPMVALRHE